MKLLKVLFWLLIPYFFYSCCDKKQYYVNISSISLSVYNKENNKDSVIVNKDTLTIKVNLDLDIKYISSNFSFISTAYATSCPPDEPLGLKNKIDSINITTDREFRGVKPPNKINSLTYPNADYAPDTIQNYDDLITYLNKTSYPYDFYFRIVKDSLESFTQKFNVAIFAHNGSIYEGVTDTITWR